MTFLFINTLYYPQHLGGAEVSVQLLCEALYRSGHKVYVISLAKHNKVSRLNGVITIYLATRNLYPVTEAAGKRKWQRIVWHLIDAWNTDYFFVVRHLLKRIRPDIVNTNNLQGFSLFTWYALKIRKVPLIHTLRDYYILCDRTTLYRNNHQCDHLCASCQLTFRIKRHFCHLPAAYIGISRHILSRHEKYYVPAPYKISAVIPNIVIPPPVKEQREIAIDKNDIKIGFIGRITPEKGVDFLMSEMSRLQGTNYTLILAGAYDEKYKIELEQQYPLRGKCEWIGNTEAATFYNKVDVVVMPAAWEEPFGRVPVEALSYNRPVCIAAKAGLLDLYREECMWQFQMLQGSLTAIMEAMLRQTVNIIEKSRQCSRFLEEYSEMAVTTRFLAMAAEVIKKERHG